MSPCPSSDDVRKLEIALEESLLALDYAQQQQGPDFAAAAVVAEVQLRLDQLRVTVEAHPERRAAWLAYLSKCPECQIVHDGPAVESDRPATPPTRLPHRPASGARAEFPVLD